ncbi:MAG: GspE/PulE family protein [Patescibacteria group bacterium]
MHIDEHQLKAFLKDSDLVSVAEVVAAEKEAATTNDSIGAVLVKRGLISPDDLRKIQAYVLGVPFVSLLNQKIPFEILTLIPEPVARNHNIVAFRKSEDSLEVAMLNVDDLSAIDFIKKKVGLKILPRLTDTESLRSVLLQYQKSLQAEFGDIIQEEAAALKQMGVMAGENLSPTDLRKLAEDLPVVRIVDSLLKHAIIQGASDIHIEPMEKEVLVRYRIDGMLRDAMTLPKTADSSITARIKVLSNLKLDEKRLPQDGRFKVETEGQKVSFRVSILPTYYGEKTVMRLLKESAGAFTLEGHNFHGEALERIHSALKLANGMVLTTGPTGSGKTTTLYTMLDILNTPDVNISTIEDPIEYQMPRVNQTQVRPDIGFTFANGLRSLVRQDPDIIMVGEIRDNETASLGINAALTGHLVLSTLHTNSSAGAIPRLMDMKVEPFLLVSTLSVVVGQRLVRRLCESRKEHRLSAPELDTLSKSVNLDRVLHFLKEEKIISPKATWKDVPFYKPVPAPECEDGYKGRVAIHEVLKITPTIRELVLRNSTSDAIEEQAKKEGMMTMLEDGIFEAARGLTTIEEVLRVVTSEA